MIRWLVNQMHVSTSDAGVEAEIRRRATKATPEQADAYVVEALEVHHENQAEYRWIMGGLK